LIGQTTCPRLNPEQIPAVLHKSKYCAKNHPVYFHTLVTGQKIYGSTNLVKKREKKTGCNLLERNI
jgi:hypothetical protein